MGVAIDGDHGTMFQHFGSNNRDPRIDKSLDHEAQNYESFTFVKMNDLLGEIRAADSPTQIRTNKCTRLIHEASD